MNICVVDKKIYTVLDDELEVIDEVRASNGKPSILYQDILNYIKKVSRSNVAEEVFKNIAYKEYSKIHSTTFKAIYGRWDTKPDDSLIELDANGEPAFDEFLPELSSEYKNPTFRNNLLADDVNKDIFYTRKNISSYSMSPNNAFVFENQKLGLMNDSFQIKTYTYDAIKKIFDKNQLTRGSYNIVDLEKGYTYTNIEGLELNNTDEELNSNRYGLVYMPPNSLYDSRSGNFKVNKNSALMYVLAKQAGTYKNVMMDYIETSAVNTKELISIVSDHYLDKDPEISKVLKNLSLFVDDNLETYLVPLGVFERSDTKKTSSSAGSYTHYENDMTKNHIRLSMYTTSESQVYTFMHELFHHLTFNSNIIESIPEAKAEYNKLEDLLQYAVDKDPSLKGIYATSNVDEFMANIFNDPDYIAKLEKIPAKNPELYTGLWQEMLASIKKIFNLFMRKDPISDPSLLDEVFEVSMRLATEILEEKNRLISQNQYYSSILGIDSDPEFDFSITPNDVQLSDLNNKESQYSKSEYNPKYSSEHDLIHHLIKYLRGQMNFPDKKISKYIVKKKPELTAEGKKKSKKKLLDRVHKKYKRYSKKGKFAGANNYQKVLHTIEELNEYIESGDKKELADVIAQLKVLKKADIKRKHKLHNSIDEGIFLGSELTEEDILSRPMVQDALPRINETLVTDLSERLGVNYKFIDDAEFEKLTNAQFALTPGTSINYNLAIINALDKISTPQTKKAQRKEYRMPQAERTTIRLNSKDKPNIETNIRKRLRGEGVTDQQIDYMFEYMRANSIKKISTKELAEILYDELVLDMTFKENVKVIKRTTYLNKFKIDDYGRSKYKKEVINTLKSLNSYDNLFPIKDSPLLSRLTKIQIGDKELNELGYVNLQSIASDLRSFRYDVPKEKMTDQDWNDWREMNRKVREDADTIYSLIKKERNREYLYDDEKKDSYVSDKWYDISEQYSPQNEYFENSLQVNDQGYTLNNGYTYNEYTIHVPYSTKVDTHFGDKRLAGPTAIAHVRGHYNKKDKTFHVLEIQSDLFQKSENLTSLTDMRGRYAEDTFPTYEVRESDQDIIYKYSPYSGSVTLTNLNTGDKKGVELYSLSEDVQKELLKRGDKYLNEITTQERLLNTLAKNNKWQSFLVDTVIQKFSNEGIDAIFFPQASTVEKIQHYEYGRNELKSRETTLKRQIEELNKEIKTANEQLQSGKYEANRPEYELVIEENTKDIEKLKQDVSEVDAHIKKMDSVKNFYQYDVKNIIDKKYKKNISRHTDKFNHEWFKVDINSDVRKKVNSIQLAKRDGKAIAAYDNNGTVVFRKNAFTDNETVLHEFTHPFVDAIVADNKKVFDKLISDILSTPDGKTIQKYVNDNYGDRDSVTKQKEILTRAIAAVANKNIDEKTGKPLIAAIHRFISWIRNNLNRLIGRKIAAGQTITARDLDLYTTVQELSDLLSMYEGRIDVRSNILSSFKPRKLSSVLSTEGNILSRSGVETNNFINRDLQQKIESHLSEKYPAIKVDITNNPEFSNDPNALNQTINYNETIKDFSKIFDFEIRVNPNQKEDYLLSNNLLILSDKALEKKSYKVISDIIKNILLDDASLRRLKEEDNDFEDILEEIINYKIAGDNYMSLKKKLSRLIGENFFNKIIRILDKIVDLLSADSKYKTEKLHYKYLKDLNLKDFSNAIYYNKIQGMKDIIYISPVDKHNYDFYLDISKGEAEIKPVFNFDENLEKLLYNIIASNDMVGNSMFPSKLISDDTGDSWNEIHEYNKEVFIKAFEKEGFDILDYYYNSSHYNSDIAKNAFLSSNLDKKYVQSVLYNIRKDVYEMRHDLINNYNHEYIRRFHGSKDFHKNRTTDLDFSISILKNSVDGYKKWKKPDLTIINERQKELDQVQSYREDYLSLTQLIKSLDDDRFLKEIATAYSEQGRDVLEMNKNKDRIIKALDDKNYNILGFSASYTQKSKIINIINSFIKRDSKKLAIENAKQQGYTKPAFRKELYNLFFEDFINRRIENILETPSSRIEKISNYISPLTTAKTIKDNDIKLIHNVGSFTKNSFEDIVKFWTQLENGEYDLMSAAAFVNPYVNLRNFRKPGTFNITFKDEAQIITAYDKDSYTVKILDSDEKSKHLFSLKHANVFTEEDQFIDYVKNNLQYSNQYAEVIVRFQPQFIDKVEYIGDEIPNYLKAIQKKYGFRLERAVKVDESNQYRIEEVIKESNRKIPIYNQLSEDQIIGQANIEAMSVIIDAVNRKEDTLAHEYAHHYIAWFRDTDIVQEGIKRFGSEEALVQKIGEQVVDQKGEAYKWWKKFSKFIIRLFSDKQLIQALTDSFLQARDLRTDSIITTKRSIELAKQAARSNILSSSKPRKLSSVLSDVISDNNASEQLKSLATLLNEVIIDTPADTEVSLTEDHIMLGHKDVNLSDGGSVSKMKGLAIPATENSQSKILIDKELSYADQILTTIHEGIHMATMSELASNTTKAKTWKNFYKKAKQKIIDAGYDSSMYALSNEDEFLTAVFTDNNFREILSSVKPVRSSNEILNLLNEVADLIKKIIGFKGDVTLLEDSLLMATDLMEGLRTDKSNINPSTLFYPDLEPMASVKTKREFSSELTDKQKEIKDKIDKTKEIERGRIYMSSEELLSKLGSRAGKNIKLLSKVKDGLTRYIIFDEKSGQEVIVQNRPSDFGQLLFAKSKGFDKEVINKGNNDMNNIRRRGMGTTLHYVVEQIINELDNQNSKMELLKPDFGRMGSWEDFYKKNKSSFMSKAINNPSSTEALSVISSIDNNKVYKHTIDQDDLIDPTEDAPTLSEEERSFYVDDKDFEQLLRLAFKTYFGIYETQANMAWKSDKPIGRPLILTEAPVYSAKKDIKGSIDLMVVYDNGKVGHFDWKFMGLKEAMKKEKFVDPEELVKQKITGRNPDRWGYTYVRRSVMDKLYIKRDAFEQQVGTYKDVLNSEYGINKGDIVQSRVTPVNMIFAEKKTGEKYSFITEEGKKVTVDKKEETNRLQFIDHDYDLLQSISLAKELTGDPNMDNFLTKLYKERDAIRVRLSMERGNENLKNSLRDLEDNIHSLVVKKDIASVATSIQNIAEVVRKNLSNPEFIEVESTTADGTVKKEEIVNPKYINFKDLDYFENILVLYSDLMKSSENRIKQLEELSDMSNDRTEKLKYENEANELKSYLSTQYRLTTNVLREIQEERDRRFLNITEEGAYVGNAGQYSISIDKNTMVNSGIGLTDRVAKYSDISDLSRYFSALSEQEHPHLRLYKDLLDNLNFIVKEYVDETSKKVERAVNDLRAYSKATGKSMSQVYDMLIEFDEKTNDYKLVRPYSKKLIEDLDAAREDRNYEWLKENLELDKEKFNKAKESYRNSYEKIYKNKRDVDEKMEEFEEQNNPEKSNYALINTRNRYVKIKQSTIDKYKSDKYDTILNNKELKSFYDTYTSVMNNIAYNMSGGGVYVDEFFIPNVRKDFIDTYVQDGIGNMKGLGGIKELLQKANEVRENDEEFGFHSDGSEDVDVIPLQFKDRIPGSLSLKSKDLGKSLLLFAYSSKMHQVSRDIEGISLGLRKSLATTKLMKKDLYGNLIPGEEIAADENTKVYKALDGYIQKYIYGRNLQELGDILGSKKRTKMLLDLMSYQSKVSLAFNHLSLLGGHINAESQILTEAARGRHFTTKQWAKSEKEVIKSGAKANLAYEFFEVSAEGNSGLIYEKANKMSLSKLRSKYNKSLAYAGQRKSDDLLDKVYITSMMQNYILHPNGSTIFPKQEAKIFMKGTEWEGRENELMSMWDAMQMEDNPEEGKPVFRVMRGDGKEEITKEQFIKFRNRVRSLASKAKGNYNSEDAYLYGTNLGMRALMQYRGWIPAYVKERYGSATYSAVTDDIEIGRYRAFVGNIIGDGLIPSLKRALKLLPMFFGDIVTFNKFNLTQPSDDFVRQSFNRWANNNPGQYEELLRKYKEFDNAEEMAREQWKQSMAGQIKKTLVEIRNYALLIGASLAIGFGVGDDELDDRPFVREFVNVLNRAQMEIGFFFSVSEMTKLVTRSPLPVYSVISDVWKLAGNTVEETKDFVLGAEYNKTVDIFNISDKGMSLDLFVEDSDRTPAFNYTLRAIPGVRGISRFLEFFESKDDDKLTIYEYLFGDDNTVYTR